MNPSPQTKEQREQIITGLQWGDEGKGKIVDCLAEEKDVIVRFQGGHNAGHTLVLGNQTFVLSMLPSSTIRPDKRSIIGCGTVVHTDALINEISRLRERGATISPKNLSISDQATIILPIHVLLDRTRESKNSKPIGTTGRGIGPAYEDKTGRRGIRFCDLAESSWLQERIEALTRHHEPELRHHLGANWRDSDPDLIIEPERVISQTLAQAKKILQAYLVDAPNEVLAARKAGKTILFEGAQGLLLDLDQGSYPYVTSSVTFPANALHGYGIFDGVVRTGIAKAYTTRVGAGPFPTELTDKNGQALGERGHEFGTVTGRKRRCGWFDAALVRQMVERAGITDWIVTKLDVLDTFDTISVGVGYVLDGEERQTLPASFAQQQRLTPRFETLPGWKSSTFGCTKLEQLPAAARRYLDQLEQWVGCPIRMISTGPDRKHLIRL